MAEKEQMTKEILRWQSDERCFRLKFADWFGTFFLNKPIPQNTAKVEGSSIWLVQLLFGALLISSCSSEDAPALLVPEGAHVSELTGLEACEFQPADSERKYFAECGTLVVPENWQVPNALLISLPVVRIPASGQPPTEPVFYLGGLLLVIGSLLFSTIALRKSWLLGAPLLAIGVLSISNMIFLMGRFKVTGYEYVGTVLLPILIGFSWTVLGYALWSYEAKASTDAHLEGI